MNGALDFGAHLRGQGYADRTVSEYSKWIRRLARWSLLHNLRLETLQPHQLREWADSTLPPGRDSRKQAHAACRHYYLWIGRDDRPWDAIRLPRKRRGSPNPLPEPDRILLRDAAVLTSGRPGLAVLGLLQTGCRPSEVARWRWDGINLDGMRIRFWRPKVSDWHTVPLRPLLAAELEMQRPAWPEGFVFVGDRGRPHVTEQTIWQWCRQVAQVAGVDGVTPRRLRATAVTRVLNVTSRLDLAADLAGHVDVNTTKNYYRGVDWDRLAEASAALD